MKFVIDISEDTFKRHKWRVNRDTCTELDIAVAKGIQIFEGHDIEDINIGDDITVAGTVVDVRESKMNGGIKVIKFVTKTGNKLRVRLEDIKTLRPHGNGGK